MSNLGQNIARRIRELRIKLGMTQQQFSEIADINLSVLSRIERGSSVNIQINTLEKIVTALNIDYPDFFMFSNSPNIKNRILAKLSLLNNDNKFYKYSMIF